MNFKKEILLSQKELNLLKKTKDYLIVKAKFGPSKETRIPLKLNEELSFFVAAIIGDGHLKKSKLQISIELTNKELIKHIQRACLKIFKRNFNIHQTKPREGKKSSSYIAMDSKAIYSLLNKVFEIPIGRKSHIVSVPQIILKSNKSIKSAFLIGIMLTEGGKRRRGFGLSTASKKLWGDLIYLFNDVGIKVLIDKWVYKKYKKEYYGLSFKKENLFLLMRRCRSGQTGQILKILF